MDECEFHPGNIQCFYCSQHYDVFCVDCGTEHLDCRDVTFLSEISETSKSMIAHLKRHNKGFQSLIEDNVRYIDGTEQKKEETLQYVEQVRSDFNRFIDNLKQDVNTRYTLFQSDIKRQIGLYEEHIQTIEKSLSELNIQILLRQCEEVEHASGMSAAAEDTSLQLKDQTHLSIVKEQSMTLPAKFDLLKYFERHLQDNFALTETSSQTRMVEWSCTITQTMDVLCRDVTTDCSDLTVLQSASSQTDLYQTSDIWIDTSTLHYPQHSEKVILSDVQVPVEVEGDHYCSVTGCVVVQDGMVVVADRYNSCVKLVKVPDMIQSGDNVGTEAGHQHTGTGTSSVLCKLTMSGIPGDVTAISQHQVAVALSDDRQIQILKVDQQKLTCVRKISTQYSYWGTCITYGRGILVMVKLDRRQKRLTVATLQGKKVSVAKVLQYTPVVDCCRMLLRYECYVTAAKDGTVYVTNNDDDTVTRLILTGEVLGQYKFEGLREPQGICVHPTDGTVFICYWRSNCILRMSPDGREIQRFKMSNPRSVYVTEDNRMIVGRLGNELHILQLS